MSVVLIVEDNRANMKLIDEILCSRGHEVLKAFDAETGLSVASERMPDIIVMDVQLPGKDGLTAIAEIRATEKIARTPIIVVTARGMNREKKQIMAAGCDAYLLKPIDYRALLGTIEQLTGESSR